jgi:hypothetical protein
MTLGLFHKVQLAFVCAFLFTGWIFAQPPGKTLLIVAHPDDEYYFAATVYRIAVQLGGRGDELIITDGMLSKKSDNFLLRLCDYRILPDGLRGNCGEPQRNPYRLYHSRLRRLHQASEEMGRRKSRL